MITFAVITLTILFALLTIGCTLIAMAILKNPEEEGTFVVCFVVLAIYIVAVFWIVKYIIIWGQVLV